jgi:hypothetical protein
MALLTCSKRPASASAGSPRGDAAAYAGLIGDPEVMRFIGDGSPAPAERAAEEIAALNARYDRDGFGVLGIERRADARLLGRAGFYVWDRRDWSGGRPRGRDRPVGAREGVRAPSAVAFRAVELELDPPQPEAVAEAIAEALAGAGGPPPVDPWWRAGIEDALHGE